MKVEVKESSKKAGRPFPKLMISINNGITVVLFSGRTTQEGKFKGAILKSASQSCDADCRNLEGSFDIEDFKDFEGEITLSND